MHRAVLMFAGAVWFSTVAPGQISLVNVTSCPNVQTGSQAFPSPCTIPATGSGHLIVVGWKSIGGTGTATVITGIADNAGNTYIEAGAARSTDSAHSAILDIWYARNSAAGATTLTITPNPPNIQGGAVVWEFAGVDPVSPVDQAVTLNNQAASNTPRGAAVTTTSGNELIISAVNSSYQINAIYPGNVFTGDAISVWGGWAHLAAGAPGTYSAQWNQSASGTYSASSVSFKAAGAVSACDLNTDGSVDILDVQLGTDMDLGIISPCRAPAGMCNPVFVQNVLNTALGQACNLTVLGISQSPLNFGNVLVGNTATQSATLTLTGTGNTTISQVTATPAVFTVSGPSLPLTLAAGASATFNVAFTPAAAGNASGNIAVVTTASGSALNSPFNVPVAGSGVISLPHNVSLTWNPSVSPGVAAYNVYRIASSSPTAPPTPYPLLISNLAPAAACNGGACAYTDTSVAAGASYWYYAAAVDANNNLSVPSNTSQAVIPIP